MIVRRALCRLCLFLLRQHSLQSDHGLLLPIKIHKIRAQSRVLIPPRIPLAQLLSSAQPSDQGPTESIAKSAKVEGEVLRTAPGGSDVEGGLTGEWGEEREEVRDDVEGVVVGL